MIVFRIGFNIYKDGEDNSEEIKSYEAMGIPVPSHLKEEGKEDVEFREMTYYMLPINILSVTETLISVKDEIVEGTIIFFNDERVNSPSLLNPIEEVKERLKEFGYEFE